MDDMSRLQLENQYMEEQIFSADQAVKVFIEELAFMTTKSEELCLQSSMVLRELVHLSSQSEGSIEGIEDEDGYWKLVQRIAEKKEASRENVKLSAEIEELIAEKSRLNARNEEDLKLQETIDDEVLKLEAVTNEIKDLKAQCEAESSRYKTLIQERSISALKEEFEVLKCTKIQLASEINEISHLSFFLFEERSSLFSELIKIIMIRFSIWFMMNRFI